MVLSATSPAPGAESQAAPKVQIGGPFELVDQHGAVRQDSDFRGRYMLVYFGYNWCPDVCPTSLLNITLALEKLDGIAPPIQPIYITVDPERDTVEEMKAYAEHFHPSLVALTGNQTQIAKAADAYYVVYEKAGEDGSADYFVDHTAFIYLMDPEGNFVRFFSHEAMAEEIATGVLEIL